MCVSWTLPGGIASERPGDAPGAHARSSSGAAHRRALSAPLPPSLRPREKGERVPVPLTRLLPESVWRRPAPAGLSLSSSCDRSTDGICSLPAMRPAAAREVRLFRFFLSSFLSAVRQPPTPPPSPQTQTPVSSHSWIVDYAFDGWIVERIGGWWRLVCVRPFPMQC